MSVTVNNLIKLLNTQENRYGGATGKPRELNMSINGNFCGCIESAKVDGHGDGLVTDATLNVEVPEMEEYYEQEIRNKAIEEFASLLSNKDNIVRYDIEEILSQSGNFDYACYCFRKYIDRIAEQMKEVG